MLLDWSPPARQTLARPPAAPPLTVADTAVAADTHNRTAPVAAAYNHTVMLAAESDRKRAAGNIPAADVMAAKAAPGKDTDSYVYYLSPVLFALSFLLFDYQIKFQPPSHYYHALQAYHPASANTMSKRTAPV